MGEHGKATALRIAEAEPTAAALSCADAVLLTPIRYHRLLMTLHSASAHGDTHGQDHGVSSGQKP